MVACVLLVGGVWSGSAAAAPKTPTANGGVTSLPPLHPAPSTVRHSAAPLAASRACPAALTGAQLDRARAQRKNGAGVAGAVCAQVGARSSHYRDPARNTGGGSDVHPNDYITTECELDGFDQNTWYYFRDQSCIWGVPVVWTTYDTDTGEVIGTADFTVGAQYDLDTTSPGFSELFEVTFDDAVGYGEGEPWTITHTATCDSQCTSTGGVGVGDYVLPGDTFDTEEDFQDYTTLDVTNFTNEWTALPPDTALINPADLENAPAVRCDDGSQVGSPYHGCVIDGGLSVLQLSLSNAGAGAAFVQWAEFQLPGGYGYYVPMTRYAGTPVWSTNDNRDVVCDRSFVHDSTVATDSCDEYAFAASYESAGLTGSITSGAQCAEVTPFETAPGSGTWDVRTKNSDTSKNCARGHVPLSQNQSVGGSYGALIQSQRVMDGDQFYVSVGA